MMAMAMVMVMVVMMGMGMAMAMVARQAKFMGTVIVRSVASIW